MAKPTLLPDPTCLHLQLLDASGSAITARVTTTSTEEACPLCHRSSSRIHSRYVRAVADLPWMGCAVHLELYVRRFFCTNSECLRQIFTERLPTVVSPYARRTMRLTDVFIMYHQKRIFCQVRKRIDLKNPLAGLPTHMLGNEPACAPRAKICH